MEVVLKILLAPCAGLPVELLTVVALVSRPPLAGPMHAHMDDA